MNDLISRQAAIKGRIFVERADGVEIYSDEVVPVSYLKNLPSAESDKRIEKIAELVEGTIDHFDREDAMDLLYQIKEVLNER